MTTCMIAKFPNVTAGQLAAVMTLVASEDNTGWCGMAESHEIVGGKYETHGGSYQQFRHISVLSVEPSKEIDGFFTVNVRVNSHLEPILCSDRARLKPGSPYHWSNRDDYAPVPVPQSLILAMNAALGIFPTE